MGLRFESLEELGKWAREYRATSVTVGDDGAVQHVGFAAPAPPELAPVFPEDTSDTERPARPRTDVDIALDNVLRGYPEAKHA